MNLFYIPNPNLTTTLQGALLGLREIRGLDTTPTPQP